MINRLKASAASRFVIFLLAAMLVLVPPGGAVCWPLPNGWHIHVGWSDAAGRPTIGLAVYAHRGPGRVFANPHRAGFSALVAPDLVNPSDLRPLAFGAFWLLTLLTLLWLRSPRQTLPRQPGPKPLEHPPKFSPAF